MRLVIVAGFCLALVALAQQPEQIEFKGIPFGITPAQFVERFPLVRCEKAKDIPGDTTCTGLREYACRLAPATLRNCNERLARDYYSYGGAEFKSISANFYSDSLISISLLFNARDFDSVLHALIARYGKPDELKTERAGATYENVFAQWRRGSILYAEKYSGNLETSGVVFGSESGRIEFECRKAERIKKGAKGLHQGLEVSPT